MFWTGKTWIKDDKEYVKKYANELLEILREQIPQIEENINECRSRGEIDKADALQCWLNEFKKNLARISNKAGKEAMISEFKALNDISCTSDEFNRNKYLLNTNDGIVDLKTGKIHPFDKKKLISKNTNCKVSFEEPKEWIKFLNSIFYRGDTDKNVFETKQIVEFIKYCLGYTICGSCDQQCMFILYGGGSNGKTTFQEYIDNNV